jgi:hypothetical protein
MRIRRRVVAAGAAALLALGAGGAALAATPAQNATFAKELRADLKPTFAKEAKALHLGAVSCTLSANKKSARCKAHFSDPAAKVDVVYTVTATVKGRTIKWSAGSPVCRMAATHKAVACG